ncbi:MAG: quinolinate synthase NadA [Candidatus Omnitrophota bacterium]|nr:quinolinate synthase NadA [Candidatus Omnitrophota bacterium]
MMRTQNDEARYKEKLREKIAELKKDKDAAIVVHNYQRPEIQDIADIKGDSLALSRAVTRLNKKVIIFCGVRFMAESASILNPNKRIILPVIEAGCPLADMVNLDQIKAKRQQFPDAAVVCYVNSLAEIKAESDICCTSSNAVKIVRSLNGYRRIIFIPDKNLGLYVASQVPEKEIITLEGFCPSHVRLSKADVLNAKAAHPAAEFLVHPECYPEVVELAGGVCSTKQMFDYIEDSKCKEFIIGTENGLLYGLEKKFPGRKFYSASVNLLCADMKLTTLGWVAHALEFMEHEIKVPENIRVKAKKTLDRMLKV